MMYDADPTYMINILNLDVARCHQDPRLVDMDSILEMGMGCVVQEEFAHMLSDPFYLFVQMHLRHQTDLLCLRRPRSDEFLRV